MTDASTAREEALDYIRLVRLVLSQYQTAYARFHNSEGRGVIEADGMAIGYAAVELEKALAPAGPCPENERSADKPQCCCNASWLGLDQRDCPIHGPKAKQPVQASDSERARAEKFLATLHPSARDAFEYDCDGVLAEIVAKEFTAVRAEAFRKGQAEMRGRAAQPLDGIANGYAAAGDKGRAKMLRAIAAQVRALPLTDAPTTKSEGA